jgi:hypothetical protein
MRFVSSLSLFCYFFLSSSHLLGHVLKETDEKWSSSVFDAPVLGDDDFDDDDDAVNVYCNCN